MTKTLRVPKADFENLDLDSALELYGARFDVNEVNWPAEWPYAPICAGRIARSDDALVVDFRVSGLDLRAQNLKDNGRQWEDSCVEFFVKDPSTDDYYNFEINPLGKILACYGPAREGRKKRSPSQMEKILRISSVEGPQEFEGGVFTWRVAVVIPFGLIGIDPDNMPESISANFYKCGDKSAHPHFVSWNPVDTPKPDFHVPACFGTLILK